jgi:hypothetical protein
MRRVVKIVLTLALVSGGACKDSTDRSSGAKADEPAPSAGAQSSPDDGSKLPDAEAVLERAVEAAGGRAVLDAVETFYFEGEIAIPAQNITGKMEVWWKGGDFYTAQHISGIGKMRAGKAGATIWSDDPINGLRRLEGVEAEQHTWASSFQLAADWQRYFESARTVEERDVDGAKVYDVKFVSASGAEVLMSFDAQTGLQVAQKYEQVTPMGSMPVSVKMEDYREVDGIKVAFKQVTDATLAKATQTLTKVEFNLEVDTSTFAMPASDNETVKKDTLMPFDAEGKPGKPVP